MVQKRKPPCFCHNFTLYFLDGLHGTLGLGGKFTKKNCITDPTTLQRHSYTTESVFGGRRYVTVKYINAIFGIGPVAHYNIHKRLRSV